MMKYLNIQSFAISIFALLLSLGLFTSCDKEEFDIAPREASAMSQEGNRLDLPPALAEKISLSELDSKSDSLGIGLSEEGDRPNSDSRYSQTILVKTSYAHTYSSITQGALAVIKIGDHCGRWKYVPRYGSSITVDLGPRNGGSHFQIKSNNVSYRVLIPSVGVNRVKVSRVLEHNRLRIRVDFYAKVRLYVINRIEVPKYNSYYQTFHHSYSPSCYSWAQIRESQNKYMKVRGGKLSHYRGGWKDISMPSGTIAVGCYWPTGSSRVRLTFYRGYLTYPPNC